MKLVKTEKDIKTDDELGEYQRSYDGETYLLLESMSRDNKLNVNGNRKFMDGLVANITKMGL